MPNEYGKILLQQIEQQRRQRLRQRAEERGLPVPPDEHSGSLSAGDTTRVADCRALAPTSAGGVSPHDFQAVPQGASRTDNSAESKNDDSHQNVAQPTIDVARALESLASLAPLLARHASPPASQSGAMTASYISSVVPAPLINQQPLLLQPTALVHPQFYQLGSQPPPYPSQRLAEEPAMERKFTLPLRSPEEALLRATQNPNHLTNADGSGGKELSHKADSWSASALRDSSAVDPGQLRLTEAKKRYQEDLLRQMREREAAREEEKSRRKREDEEERIRLSKEIEQERLQKAEEDARQLVKSKQLAAANVAAAGRTKQRDYNEFRDVSLDAELCSQNGLPKFKRSTSNEQNTLPENENATKNLERTTLLQELAKEPEKSEHLNDKRIHQMPVNGVDVERLIVLGLEALQAEVRMQTEEMRFLKNQQRQVLQQIHKGNGTGNVWCECERQDSSVQAGDCCPQFSSSQPRSFLFNSAIPAHQRELQNRRALITLMLRNAGVSDPEDLVRRLADSGIIFLSSDAASSGAVPISAFPCHFANEVSDAAAQAGDDSSLCNAEKSWSLHHSPTKHSLSRGPSKSSCCSLREITAETFHHLTKDENLRAKQENAPGENPEDRPLPTLLKCQQQWKASRLLCHAAKQSQCLEPQQDAAETKWSGALTQRSNHRFVDNEVQGQGEGEARQYRHVLTKQLSKSLELPADRKWRLNELCACISHCVPQTSSHGPTTCDPGTDCAARYIFNSYCTSQCESELPCQTIILPYTTECARLPVGQKQSKARVPRHLEPVAKDGWPSISEMETLEGSTAQTEMPEEHICHTKPTKVESGRVWGRSGAAQETTGLTGHKTFDTGIARLVAEFNRNQIDSVFDQVSASDTRPTCTASSVNAAPIKFQEPLELECQVLQQFSASEAPSAQSFRRSRVATSHPQVQDGPVRTYSLPHAQERLKSKLSWEADTALPVDEGSPAQSHAMKAQSSKFGPRPSATSQQPPLAMSAQQGDHQNTPECIENFSPIPATPPNKHALPTKNNCAPPAAVSNGSKSWISRGFGGRLARSNSRPRQ